MRDLKNNNNNKIHKTGGLNVMYTNADMLHNKLDEIETIANDENLDIIAVTETLLKNMPPDSKPEDFVFVIKGFNTIYNYNGRGLCLFIKKQIDFNQVYDYDKYFKTSLFINIKNSQCNLTLGVIYRSPNTPQEENVKMIEMLNVISSNHISLNNKLLIMGDFNFPGINWELECTNHQNEMNIENQFLTCIQNNFLFQLVDQPTHCRGLQTPTLIDLIITNDPNILGDIAFNAPVGNSHHCVMLFKLYVNVFNINNEINKQDIKYNYEKGNYTGMRDFVKNCDWNVLFNKNSNVDEWKENLENVLNDARDKFVPKIVIKETCNKPKRSFPANKSILEKIHDKRKAFAYFKKYPTHTNEQNYHFHRNVVNSAVKKAKLTKELNIANKIKTNPKCFFNYVNSQLKPRECISNLKREDGSMTETDQEKAEVLNSFFSSVFVKENDEPIPELDVDIEKELNNIIITDNDMLDVLKNLNPSKSPGPDKIHPRLIKELSNELAGPLHLLFDKTISDGGIPKSWKEAEVKPIFKKGNKETPGDYRPVSLTSVICRIFEHFIRNALYNHLVNNSILSKDQYGFCKKRSCVSQLLVTIDEWFSYLDKKIPVDAAYLDFRKAFDSVPHKRLIYKLDKYGIKGNILNWIKSFLSDRTQFVNVNNNYSEKAPVLSGVPQGSVLGPCLFLYYINDLPEVIKCLIKLFADDSKAYQPIKTILDNKLLQHSINDLVKWTEKWLLKFNNEKCKILHLGKNNPKYKYHIKQGDLITDLQETINEKDLGVFIDPFLSFDNHISYTIKRARRMAGMLIRTIKNKYPNIMTSLFKSLVRPILEYALAVWCPYKRKHIDEIEKVQRQFTRHIKGLKNLSYHDRLRKLKLPSLEYRRLRGDFIEVYKIVHKIYDPLTTNSLLTLDLNLKTRTNSLKLKKKRTNYQPYQCFFTNRVTSNWNRLSKDIVCAESLNIFKNKLDAKFKDLIYSTYIKIQN